MGSNLISKIKKLYINSFCFLPIDRELFKYFHIKSKKETESKNIVLVQCVEDYFYFGLFGIIINSLRQNRNIKVDQFVARNLTYGASRNIKSMILSVVFNNRFRDNKWIKLYSSYCDNVAYRHEGSSNIITDLKLFIKAYRIFKNIHTKEDVISLIYDGIKIGDLIYDTYLRFKPAPTVCINDFYLIIIIWQSLRNIDLAKKYFRKNSPQILLTSYSTYIQHGITVRVALQTQTKVYSFGNFQSFSKELTSNDYYHTSNFWNYKDNFDMLTNKDIYLDNAKEALENRLDGKKDIATSYMKKSAYEVKITEIPDIEGSIVVFLHDFFDSPHIYGNMMFPDFLEWIEFTIKILEKYKIPYYLKPHPNQIDDSVKIVKELKVKYPQAKFISSNITNKQLVDNGMKVGISVYGTIAHELAYMGIPIILCGDNPHSSYDFCFEATNKEKYIDLIQNYKNLKIPANVKKEVESFYYMHNLNISDEHKVLISSFVDLFKYCSNQKVTFETSQYFNKLQKITVNIEFKNFINKLFKRKNDEESIKKSF